MDLFDYTSSLNTKDQPKFAVSPPPLAHLLRPNRLEDMVGQKHLIGKGRILRKWIESDQVPSLLFWGPPGCGKTTLATIVAETTSRSFISISAVLDGIKEIREAVAHAERELGKTGIRTLLFIDEIHRFNKAQQDALLPHLERGLLTLIGATTENPSFSVNSALLSRLRVLKLEAVPADEILLALKRAQIHANIKLCEAALLWLAQASDGDVRRALTLLESVTLNSTGSPCQNDQSLSLEDVQNILGDGLALSSVRFDRAGDDHYDIASAFIKSIRGSDPHAALYYLARMLEGGEDLGFITRRLIISASEDIGNADPRALQVALTAAEAVDRIGLPEARIVLAQAATYLAVAPKSNAAYMGINEAISEVKKSGSLPVPNHLRNASSSLAKQMGYGKGYQYAHALQGQKPLHPHLPEAIGNLKFYRPTENGLEKAIKKAMSESSVKTET